LESGDGNWTLSGGWAVSAENPYAGSYGLSDSPGGNYPDNNTATATLNGSFRATALSFWHEVDTEDDWDYCFIQFSANGGPWMTLDAYDGARNWSPVTLTFPEFAGEDIRFRFQLVSDTYITEDGWYLDDVTVTGYSDDNETPPPPILLAPVPDAVTGGQATLFVSNSFDPDGPGPLQYGFRVYRDNCGCDLAASVDRIAEGVGETSWTTPTLADGTYYWRAYAGDTEAFGLLGEQRRFVVDSFSAAGQWPDQPRLLRLGPTGGGQASLQLLLPGAAQVQLAIYDARGALVRQLYRGVCEAGARTIVWDGRDGGGRQVASGVYFAVAKLAEQKLTARFVLVR
ncbi:MAG: FlgD immunoglobulin-like domain containing protein, partial [bacterium]